MNHRLSPHAFAVALEVLASRSHLTPARPGEADRADRLARCAAAGTGDAGDRDGDRAAAAAQRAARHLARGLLAHRAVLRSVPLAHAQHLALGRVRIGDVAALEPVRRARDRGHRLRDPAAGARLRGDEHRARVLQRAGRFSAQERHQKNTFSPRPEPAAYTPRRAGRRTSRRSRP